VLIQYVGLSTEIFGEVENKKIYSHAACLVKHNGELFLLDASEDGPMNLTKNNELAKEWLLDVQYMIMFQFAKKFNHENTINPLADVFDRIYAGKPAARGGSRQMPLAPSRERAHKNARVKSADEPRGQPGKRTAESTEKKRRLKKNSEIADSLE
jgi:hypothetical protein